MDKGRSECLKNEQMDSFVEAFVGLRHYLFILNFFFFLLFGRVAPCGMWDLNSQAGIKPTLPALEAQSLNCQTTREIPRFETF